MQIEIIEAYLIMSRPKAKDKTEEKTKKPKGWSLHVYFPEIGVDLRGVYLRKMKNHWWLGMPSKANYDPEEKEEIIYPIFSLSNYEENEKLKKDIKEKAIEYIKENVEKITIKKKSKKII